MKMYDKFFRCDLIALLFFGLSSLSYAAETKHYSTDELSQLTKQWLTQQLPADSKITLAPLDKRLGQKRCDEQLQWKWLGTAKSGTVQLSCPTPRWQLYINARVSQIATAVSARQNIAAGSVLSADMLEARETEIKLVRGQLVSDPALVHGSRVKRSLAMGQIVTLQDLCLVCKGDLVTIVSSHGALEVQTQGIAQQDAILGQQVEVLNRQSQKLVFAEVVAVKKVAIKL